MRNLIFTLSISLITTVNVYSQTSTAFESKQTSLEAGLGMGMFFGEENINFYRLQLNTRDLFFNRLGVNYTMELSNPNTTYFTDLIGLSYRLNNNFSIQAASGLLSKASIFKTKSFRKEISFAYHPISNPLTYTLGYSITHGPTLTVNFKLFRKDKNKKSIKQPVESAGSNTTYSVPNDNTESITQPVESNELNTIYSNPNQEISKSISKNTLEDSALKHTPVASAPIKKTNIEQQSKDNLPASHSKTSLPVPSKKELELLCSENQLNNNYNQYDLSEVDKLKLLNFVTFLNSNKKYKLKIIGRADNIGSESFNLKLGQKRADNAKNFLIKNGVSTLQIISTSIGESKSQNANTKAERKLARKTIFEIISPN